MNRLSLLALTLASVALVGGTAWALAIESVDLPTAGNFAVEAAITPGDGGGVVLSGGGGFSEEVDLSIGFDPDGVCRVDGSAAGYVAGHSHSVMVGVQQTASGWMAHVTVTDNATGALVLSCGGIGLGTDAPRRATASGLEVQHLSAK
ncbi:MAG: hypothetical protein ACYTGN_02280 [Planctomycetota bacterium]|jgi:hypothetical protein